MPAPLLGHWTTALHIYLFIVRLLNQRTGVLSLSQPYPQWLEVSGPWRDGGMDVHKGLAHLSQEPGTRACDLGKERDGWTRWVSRFTVEF